MYVFYTSIIISITLFSALQGILLKNRFIEELRKNNVVPPNRIALAILGIFFSISWPIVYSMRYRNKEKMEEQSCELRL